MCLNMCVQNIKYEDFLYFIAFSINLKLALSGIKRACGGFFSDPALYKMVATENATGPQQPINTQATIAKKAQEKITRARS